MTVLLMIYSKKTNNNHLPLIVWCRLQKVILLKLPQRSILWLSHVPTVNLKQQQQQKKRIEEETKKRPQICNKRKKKL